ncbi:MAG: hypothetical protein HY840_12220 [Bacteroidetes bacterium]|nr:hypothetical protein [Bacteroidota bacterium]
MIFITHNDSPSGIYYSQVTDVCNFLNKKLNARIRLVSLISVRNYLHNRRSIKLHCPGAIVIPMVPCVRNWSWNFIPLLFLFLFLDSKKVIARGPFAASMALWLKKIGIIKWVCFDARGGSVAEFSEYNVVGNSSIKRDIFKIESNAVLNSDFRVSVSNALVNYWKEKFSYSEAKHIVIPCLLHSEFFNLLPNEKDIRENRKALGFSDEDIVLVYSGSLAGWQSMKLVDDFLSTLFKRNSNIKFLFLAKEVPRQMKILAEFGDRIVCKWLPEDKVSSALSSCDYGILIREKSITNQVASPVKFAEYLACGLKILISEYLGDYTEFVMKNNCGHVVLDEKQSLHLSKLTIDEKIYLRNHAMNYFSKDAFMESYKLLIQK